MRLVVAAAFLAFSAASAFAQGAVLQGGPSTAGRAPMYSTTGQGGQTVVQDSGPASGGAAGLGLKELLLVKRGTGTPPIANQGTGPLGTSACMYDAPTTNAAGYHFLCLDPNAQGGALLAYGAGGGAGNLPLNFNINGTSYQFPFSSNGVVGPNTSTVGHVALWNNVAGTLLAQDLPATLANTLTISRNAAALPAGPAGTVLQLGNADSSNMTLLGDVFGSAAVFPAWTGRHARGTAAAPTALQSGDFLSIFSGIGYGATGYGAGVAQIRLTATENFTDGAQGSRVAIWTTPNGSTGSAIAEALRIDQDKSTTAFGLLKAGPSPATASTDSVALLSKNASTCPQHDPATAANENWVLQMCMADSQRGGFGIDVFGGVGGTFGAFGVMDFRRANGTAAAPTALQAGDLLGVVGALGRQTTKYSGGAAQIRWYAAENFTDTASGAYLSLITAVNGADSHIFEGLRIDQDRSTNVFGTLVVNANNATDLPAVGATLPLGPTGTIVHAGNNAAANSVVLNDAWGTSHIPVYNTRFARGSAASPTAAQSNDIIGVVAGMGYGSTGYSDGVGQIRFTATQNFTDGAQGTRIALWTTPNGSTSGAIAEALRVDQDKSTTAFGNLTVNKNAATLPAPPAGTVLQLGNADASNMTLLGDVFGDATVFAAWTGRHARGTAAAPTALQSGDFLSIFSGIGYGSSGYSGGVAQIRLTAAQTFTDAAQGSRISLYTTPNGSTGAAIAEALRIDQDKSATSFGVLTVNRNAATLPTPPSGTVAQLGNSDSNATIAILDTFGSVANNIPIFNTRRARGTAAAPTAVQSGDYIGIYAAIGYAATGYTNGVAQVRLSATQNFTDTAQGTRISLWTTPNGSTDVAMAEALRVDQDRSVTAFGALTVNKNAGALPAGPTGTVVQIGAADTNNMTVLADVFGDATVFPAWTGRHARGTAAAPTALQSGDFLSIFSGIGYGATGYSAGVAQIRLTAAQNFTDAAQGTRVAIWTTPNGSTGSAIAEALRIDQDKSTTLFGTLSVSGVSAAIATGTAIPAGGTAGTGYLFSSTANFGVFFGSNAPTLSAAKGSLYLRSDGSSTSTRAYINTDGGATWTAITTGSWLFERDLNPANDNRPAFIPLAA